MYRVSGPVVCRGLIASPLHPWRPVAPGGGDGPVARRSGWAQKMWQNVSKIFPLFCGKIFEIFCHGLPAGGGQLFRTSTIFLPLLTPTFRQTRVNDSWHCVKFCCLRKSNSSMLCTRYQLGLSLTSIELFCALFSAALSVVRKSGQGFNAWFFADKHCAARRHSRMRAVAVDFAATAACSSGPSGPSGPSCQVFRDPTCACVHRAKNSDFPVADFIL